MHTWICRSALGGGGMLNLSIFMGSVDGAGWSTSHSHLARMLGIHRRKSLSRLPSFLLFSVFVPERCCLRFFPPRERQRQAVPDEQVQGQHHRHQPRGRQPPAGHAALPHLQQPAQAHQQQGARCGVYGDVPAPQTAQTHGSGGARAVLQDGNGGLGFGAGSGGRGEKLQGNGGCGGEGEGLRPASASKATAALGDGG